MKQRKSLTTSHMQTSHSPSRIHLGIQKSPFLCPSFYWWQWPYGIVLYVRKSPLANWGLLGQQSPLTISCLSQLLGGGKECPVLLVFTIISFNRLGGFPCNDLLKIFKKGVYRNTGQQSRQSNWSKEEEMLPGMEGRISTLLFVQHNLHNLFNISLCLLRLQETSFPGSASLLTPLETDFPPPNSLLWTVL